MRVAAIDLGTNSFLCLIAEGVPGQMPRVLEDSIQITRLGQGVHESRQFSLVALRRAEAAFKVFRQRLDHFKVARVEAIATSAARDVTNGHQLIELGAKYDIPIQIIGGDQEAQLTFDGATFDEIPMKGALSVIDVGGGSTEIIRRPSNSFILAKHSFDLGAVRLTEMFVRQDPIPSGELSKMTHYINDQLQPKSHLFFNKENHPPKVIAVGGTPTSLASAILDIEYNPHQIDGQILSKKMLQLWVHRLAEMTTQERARLKGVGPKRADIIVAGVLILDRALAAIGVDALQVSIKGLRYGLIREMLK